MVVCVHRDRRRAGRRRWRLGCCAIPAGRQGRESRRHGPPRGPCPSRVHDHDCSVQRVLRRWWRASSRALGRCRRRDPAARVDDWQGVRGLGGPAARRLPIGGQVLDAGDDGHGAEHRPQRCGRGAHDCGDGRRTIRARLVSAPDPDVRWRRARRRRRAFRTRAARST